MPVHLLTLLSTVLSSQHAPNTYTSLCPHHNNRGSRPHRTMPPALADYSTHSHHSQSPLACDAPSPHSITQSKQITYSNQTKHSRYSHRRAASHQHTQRPLAVAGTSQVCPQRPYTDEHEHGHHTHADDAGTPVWNESTSQQRHDSADAEGQPRCPAGLMWWLCGEEGSKNESTCK